MNPRVDDIPARFSVQYRNVHLLQMGTVRGAAMGCACPENAVLKTLVAYLLLREQETVILDMVAGLEHLGRGTAGAVDAMFAIVEPGARSLHTAKTIAGLARDLGVREFWVVGNKVRRESDEEFIRNALPGLPVVGYLPYTDSAVEADMRGEALYDVAPELADEVRKIAAATLSKGNST
jgi:CO dehydrogenase maturation factor